MSRLALLLIALWTVKVLAVHRLKRAAEGGGEKAVSGVAGAGVAGSNATVALPVPARRNYESKPTPRKNKDKDGKDRSTSSSSAVKDKEKGSDSDNEDKESLNVEDSSESSKSDGKGTNKKYVPLSTEERHGWMKWHRKCTKCPEDQKKKWRDPSIKWVCGAYQRARRSFKSLCMMRYRNCQDGTMFVKIHDHRCANSSADDSRPHGEHFMYDYKVDLSGDSSNSQSSASSESSPSSSKSSKS